MTSTWEVKFPFLFLNIEAISKVRLSIKKKLKLLVSDIYVAQIASYNINPRFLIIQAELPVFKSLKMDNMA